MSPLAHGHKGGLVLFEVTRSKIVPFAGRHNELEIISETNHTREDNCTPPTHTCGNWEGDIKVKQWKKRGGGLRLIEGECDQV